MNPETRWVESVTSPFLRKSLLESDDVSVGGASGTSGELDRESYDRSLKTITISLGFLVITKML